MRWLVLVLLVTGCDIVLGLDENPPTMAAIDAPPTACEGTRSEVARNMFSNDTELFSGFDPAETEGKNQTVNGEYVATTRVPAGYASIQTNVDINFSRATAQVRLVSIPAPPNTEAFFGLHLDDEQYYFFSIDSEVGMARKQNGVDALDAGSIEYMPQIHAFLRFRHDGDADEIVFETSIDGSSWIPRHRIQVKFDLRAVRVRMGAGAYPVGNPTAQTGVFDDYVFCR